VGGGDCDRNRTAGTRGGQELIEAAEHR
jgi:hypothetical protein